MLDRQIFLLYGQGLVKLLERLQVSDSAVSRHKQLT